jgi:hypothetical protein
MSEDLSLFRSEHVLSLSLSWGSLLIIELLLLLLLEELLILLDLGLIIERWRYCIDLSSGLGETIRE